MDHSTHDPAPLETTTGRDYIPLGVILAFCGALALATHWHALMNGFMGYFFICFALFKFLDLKGFVEGFAHYDLITQRTVYYGYAYPFFEFILGVAYLTQTWPILTDVATILLMGVSAAGVIRSLFQGHHFSCACLGNTLRVPLSTVSVLENVGMGLMALWQLWHRF